MAAYAMLDSGDLSPDEWKHVREILDWFNQNLPHPPKNFAAGRAIFWFRSGKSASECISRIWELVYLLRGHGHHVEVHKCRHLGNIFYYDKFQVAAYPSKLDHKIIVQ